ncbi:MAG: hypothetical protein LBT23_09315, partial [Synergistaceae bacterium]|nr:hypothetical protein [Synergistaceae bacterium]
MNAVPRICSARSERTTSSVPPTSKRLKMFAWIPMESVLYQNRQQYYQAIEYARKANDSGVFIEFTLSALSDVISAQEKRQVESSDTHLDMLKSLESKNLADKLPIKV